MAVAWLLTVLAWAGIAAGIYLSEPRRLSSHLAAAGGGLLFGISLFWIVPEMSGTSGMEAAVALALAACGALALLDRFLVHTGHSPRHGVLAPLFLATAIHSFLDGWSVRALSTHPLANVAVPLGLALHKIPEGLALGWVTRRSVSRTFQAAVACALVEALTVVGAAVQPGANETGSAAFGTWWTVAVLAVIAGSLLFLGLHAVLPNWKKAGVVTAFLGTLLLVGIAGALK
jgi:zinc transporter ZupT